MFAAGFRSGDLVHNAFSYHMTPGAFLMESGAHAVGLLGGALRLREQGRIVAEKRPYRHSVGHNLVPKLLFGNQRF